MKSKRRLKRSERARQNREAQARYRARTGPLYDQKGYAYAMTSYWKRRAAFISGQIREALDREAAEQATSA